MTLPRYELLFVREVGFDRSDVSTVRRIAVALLDPLNGVPFTRIVTGTLCNASRSLSITVGDAQPLGEGHQVRRSSPFPVMVTETVRENAESGHSYTLNVVPHGSAVTWSRGADRETCVRYFDAHNAFRCNGRSVEGYTPLVTLRASPDYLDDL